MEPDIALGFGSSRTGGRQHVAIAAAINPPTCHQVLARLAEYLTPPRSLVVQPSRAQVRSGAYDNLAAHCLVEDSRPHASKMWAYDACTQVIEEHSRSFYFSARLLPEQKRHGIMALYAFCRLSDDIVDNPGKQAGEDDWRGSAEQSLAEWARVNSDHATATEHPVVAAWADTRARHGIPSHLADELLAGVRMDLTIDRYQTWDELWLYCYRVASTVGLMSMYITGAETMEAVPYAVHLGVALQLTNILRDVGEDARAGRIYLPAEDMERCGYTEQMLMDGVINDNFVRLMRFEIDRANALYELAWPGIAMLPADSRMGVAAAGTVYRGILSKIEEAKYNVFTHRAHLTTAEKLRALPAIWWNTKRTRSI